MIWSNSMDTTEALRKAEHLALMAVAHCDQQEVEITPEEVAGWIRSNDRRIPEEVALEAARSFCKGR